MTPQNAVAPAVSGPDSSLAVQDQSVTIETRFGALVFDRENAIYMPRGLMGYADYRDFGITDMPDPRLDQFKLLQSFSEPSLSFAVAPLAMENGLVEACDIADACRMLSVAFENAAVLLIVATRRIANKTQVSVNLRAPVIIDSASRTGWQHVLGNSRYPVRHVIADVNHSAD